MPATSEKQKNFFGAVMGAKKGKKGSSPEAKKVAKEMPEKEIKKFLKTDKEEDEQSVAKQIKKNGKAVFDGPKTKERKRFAPPTKAHASKKGTYKRSPDKNILYDENTDIDKFIECVLLKKHASANKYLNSAIESKIQAKIEEELKTPLFQTI